MVVGTVVRSPFFKNTGHTDTSLQADGTIPLDNDWLKIEVKELASSAAWCFKWY